MIVERPAARIRQGNLTLFATSLRVRDLTSPNFYQIEVLDPNQGAGYQRLLNEARAKRLAEYLLDAHEAREAFLPTSIFLATDKLVHFDEATSRLRIDTDKAGPFNVVDGQHRIRGLVIAAERNPGMLDFEVPVNVAVGLDGVSQMCHFLIVNTTQRSVDRAIEQQIVARLTDMVDFEKTPVLPRWIQRQVEKGEDSRAIAISQHLHAADDSPWKGRIRMANAEDDESGSATINQKSFVTSLKKHILNASNPIAGPTWTADRQGKVLANYWGVVSDLLVDDSADVSVVFRTNGMHLFHMVSPAIFLHLANRRDFKRESIRELLDHGFESLASEFLDMSTPGFWHRGGKASGLNQAAIRKYANALATAVNAPRGASGDVEL